MFASTFHKGVKMMRVDNEIDESMNILSASSTIVFIIFFLCHHVCLNKFTNIMPVV